MVLGLGALSFCNAFLIYEELEKQRKSCFTSYCYINIHDYLFRILITAIYPSFKSSSLLIALAIVEISILGILINDKAFKF